MISSNHPPCSADAGWSLSSFSKMPGGFITYRGVAHAQNIRAGGGRRGNEPGVTSPLKTRATPIPQRRPTFKKSSGQCATSDTQSCNENDPLGRDCFQKQPPPHPTHNTTLQIRDLNVECASRNRNRRILYAYHKTRSDTLEDNFIARLRDPGSNTPKLMESDNHTLFRSAAPS